jgi:CubicO group peptidase (beta-lactamase class C family)
LPSPVDEDRLFVAMTVEGETAPGWASVREAVARVEADQGGALAVAAFHRGRPVVDLWAGTARQNTLFHTWSAVKPVAGTCLLLLVDRGRLRLDDRVADFWPELAAAQPGLRVWHLLSHSAGLVRVPAPGTAASLLDWDRTVAGLARQPPAWTPPGTAVGEHAHTFGHLVGEPVRRIDGRPLGRFLADELCGPLGLDIHIGVPEADLSRVVDTTGLTAAWWAEHRGSEGSVRRQAVAEGVDHALVNGLAWRRGEVPAVNGHASARALAGFYARFLTGDLPAAFGQPGAAGMDLVLGRQVQWSLAGGQIDAEDVGMGGIGGQWACARPGLGLAWAFLTSVMGTSARAEAVEKAILECARR